MSACRVSNDGCPGVVEAWVTRECLKNVAGCKSHVLKSSWPPAARVADPSILYVARDYSFTGEGGAKMPNVRQIINRLPESTVDNEEQRERSLTLRKPEFSELARIIAITDPLVEKRRRLI
jgi:hypothetical protein